MKLHPLGLLLLAGMASAAALQVRNWYGARYVTPAAFGTAAKLKVVRSGKTWTVSNPKHVAVLTADETRARLDGKPWTLIDPPMIIEGTYMLPLDDLGRVFKITGLKTVEKSIEPDADLHAPAVQRAPTQPVARAPVQAAQPVQTAQPAQAPAPPQAAQPPLQAAPQAAEAPTPIAPEKQVQVSAQGPANQRVLYILAHGDDLGGSGTIPAPNDIVRLCQRLILTTLKSPATARFDSPDVILQYDPNIFQAGGDVDSQNGYGALVRGRYSCFFQYSSGGLRAYTDVTTR